MLYGDISVYQIYVFMERMNNSVNSLNASSLNDSRYFQ